MIVWRLDHSIPWPWPVTSHLSFRWNNASLYGYIPSIGPMLGPPNFWETCPLLHCSSDRNVYHRFCCDPSLHSSAKYKRRSYVRFLSKNFAVTEMIALYSWACRSSNSCLRTVRHTRGSSPACFTSARCHEGYWILLHYQSRIQPISGRIVNCLFLIYLSHLDGRTIVSLT